MSKFYIVQFSTKSKGKKSKGKIKEHFSIHDKLSRAKKLCNKHDGSLFYSNTLIDAYKQVEELSNCLAKPKLFLFKEKNKKLLTDVGNAINNKVCVLCRKPHKSKTHLCSKCNRNKLKLGTTINKLVFLKDKYNVVDVFKFIDENPDALLDDDYTISKGMDLKRVVRKETLSLSYKLGKYTKFEGEVPDYIILLFKKTPHKEFLTLSGSLVNPYIHYFCHKCNKEFVTHFKDFNKGHNCDGSKSSGQIAVELFLKDKISFKTEYNTLKCRNPVTSRQLPYDVEIPSEKIIIEIHGEQHYRYIPHFHRTFENFEYQQFKDGIKKEFAIDSGYQFVEINYNDIETGNYKKKIMNVLDIQELQSDF